MDDVSRRVRWGNAGKAVDLRAAKRDRIVQGEAYRVKEFGFATWLARDPPVPCRAVARRHVEQHLLQIVGLQKFGNDLLVELIRPHIFDSAKSGARGSLEAIQKTDLGKQH